MISITTTPRQDRIKEAEQRGVVVSLEVLKKALRKRVEETEPEVLVLERYPDSTPEQKGLTSRLETFLQKYHDAYLIYKVGAKIPKGVKVIVAVLHREEDLGFAAKVRRKSHGSMLLSIGTVTPPGYRPVNRFREICDAI